MYFFFTLFTYFFYFWIFFKVIFWTLAAYSPIFCPIPVPKHVMIFFSVVLKNEDNKHVEDKKYASDEQCLKVMSNKNKILQQPEKGQDRCSVPKVSINSIWNHLVSAKRLFIGRFKSLNNQTKIFIGKWKEDWSYV